ncbi:exodeoxyribonuclease VII small subunit [Pseudoalteromonas luteoviolacea]|uniref:Exodeoxyribonuclease 7 small subunit n=1 Tax=Pseudoalteromonas luteoviolacea DSM 6061 TaxID=1365250 RepID=A0A161XTZ3_9GAMM|nr:exodeoxyribonuclease VII small subunit [Pseudoalteromonas luteoviolacea]KZN33355.1 exodeoxyribonuclease VII small subunit [Pseudoalteromonas luteoviolacea DSM 6061]KZN54912.1 exodeoxyribonuclease VII small subunit [Pseudoalteromonas luteoviolacea CPMOR-2]MBE0387241.1 exodeoxyribonuclease VII small subunit [Pseudoalteromonas luteoviolacea DSM 6061]TQF72070.1 exodeoxyribonuclease VII small subunit [Pseudoalteromonas luteoviolacea]
MAVKKPENMSFEEAVTELETIVQEMERGELTLDQSLKQFERGVKLAQASNQKLQQAEQKVSILLANDETAAPSEFSDQVE